jgi:hypothetical protein
MSHNLLEKLRASGLALTREAALMKDAVDTYRQISQLKSLL